MPYTKTHWQLEATRRKKEKEEEDQAAQKRNEEERKADERQKKTEEVKKNKQQEIEEATKKSKEEEEHSKQAHRNIVSPQIDRPDKGINDLNNNVTREDMDVSWSLGTEQKYEEVRSPQRNKKKKDKKKDKKDKKNEKAEAESILCPGSFGRAREGDKRQIRMPSKLQHFHKHSRLYVDDSITLEADDKHMEFTQTIGKLVLTAKR